MSSGLSASFETLFSKMESFVTTKTVVGEPITVGDVILLPLVDVSFGVGAGAYDDSKESKKDERGAGGGGLGAKITPSAVVVVKDGEAKIMNIHSQYTLDKLIDLAPEAVSKISALFGQKDKKDKKKDSESESTD